MKYRSFPISDMMFMSTGCAVERADGTVFRLCPPDGEDEWRNEMTGEKVSSNYLSIFSLRVLSDLELLSTAAEP